jgi:hypothetical protein
MATATGDLSHARTTPSAAAAVAAYAIATLVDVLVLWLFDPALVTEANPLLVALGGVAGIAGVALLRGALVVGLVWLAVRLDGHWSVTGAATIGTVLTLAAVVANLWIQTHPT